MKATITYKMEQLPHPFDAEAREKGTQAWCLVEVVTPYYGPRTSNPIAIFNFDSEAERFQGQVLAAGLDKSFIEIDPDVKELLTRTGMFRNF